jgi:TolB-like protein/class 3 adenylate cyclase/Flp pilus assembly protein TadD
MRQLVAILFADMTGYTALMQENEQMARTKRQRLKEVLELSIINFNGKILQYYGDGSLSIFNSAIDGVRCAINMQQQLQQDPKVDVRIGIHTGDVTVEDGAIYGDGVNMASRIESMAVSGSIFISEKVYDEIRNQDNISAREIGYFELKNIKRPVRIFAISNPGVVVPARHELQGKTKQPSNRLAVLPFVNMSADPENEYFSDGITEELLNALTKVDGLQVTSRTSAFAYKGKNDDIRDIAINLNVDKILEGSVRKSGNRVRITAQLINAADGYHIWSENYDRDLTDIFQVQDEISGIITNRLRENLTMAQKATPLVKAPTTNVHAYTFFLKGLHYWNKVTPADARKAIECFEQALAIEPGYAHAYAMVAAAYSYLGSGGQVSPHKAFEIVHRYADKALHLNSSIAESHIAKACAFLFYDWNWKEAYDALQNAIRINSGATEAYRLLGFYYIIVGKKEEAVKVLEEAIKLDPLSPSIINSLGNAYVYVERYEDAIRQAEKVLEMHPEMRICLELKAWANAMLGDIETAFKIFQEIHRLTNHPLKALMGIGYCYAKLGHPEKTIECIRKVEQRQIEEPDAVLDGDLVGLWFSLGDYDKTFYHINQCVEKRVAPVNMFLEYPAFKELRKDPRWEDLKKRVAV